MVSLSLNQALASVLSARLCSGGSQYAQANYPWSTSSTVYAAVDGWSSMIEGQPIQLPHHAIPVPITQAHIPFHSDRSHRSPVDAAVPRFKGDMQDHACDNTVYSDVAPPTWTSSILLPHAWGYPLRYPQDNGSAPRFGKPLFVHDATAGFTTGLVSRGVLPGHTDLPDHHQDVSSWSASPNPVMPSIQGPYPSGYLGSENFPMPLGRTTDSDQFTGQTYPLPSKPTEIASTPDVPCDVSHILPTPSQSDLNAQVVSSRTSAPIPQPPNSPPSPPSNAHPYESPFGIADGNLPASVASSIADCFHTRFMIDPGGANRARGRAKAGHRTMMQGSPRASEPISAHHTGHCVAKQSRSRIRPSACPLRDPNIQTCCGWQNPDGSPCGALLTHHDCAGHFATAHDIKKLAADVEVLCRWCPLSMEKKIMRHNILRHLREVHLRCPRTRKRES
ncbi:hypothetical protein EDD16DRAFT_1557259 [Pisolithus croceorrhizus]|nr:hypothetical protein EDD16DRAFT_1557259 [Pisolithus croceorrhizus]